MNKGIFTIILVLGVLVFNACSSISPANNPEVQKFINRFSKQQFLIQMEDERKRYEDIARMLKHQNKETGKIIELYQSTQSSYNMALDYMTEDIAPIKNIVSFQVFDSERKYKAQLDRARDAGRLYEIEANKAMGVNKGVVSTVFVLLDEVYPLIKNVHDKYLLSLIHI